MRMHPSAAALNSKLSDTILEILRNLFWGLLCLIHDFHNFEFGGLRQRLALDHRPLVEGVWLVAAGPFDGSCRQSPQEPKP